MWFFVKKFHQEAKSTFELFLAIASVLGAIGVIVPAFLFIRSLMLRSEANDYASLESMPYVPQTAAAEGFAERFNGIITYIIILIILLAIGFIIHFKEQQDIHKLLADFTKEKLRKIAYDILSEECRPYINSLSKQELIDSLKCSTIKKIKASIEKLSE